MFFCVCIYTHIHIRMFKFEVFSFHTWDNSNILNFLVMGYLDSFLTGLYCIKNKDLAFLSLSLICCIYKAFSDKPDVVCKQTSPASTERESLGYSTWDQLLLYQSDTVIYEVSNPLAFEEFWPSHLSFVFISVVLVTHCPYKPWNGSVDLVANEWRVVPPFLRRETKLWMRNQERMGKWVTGLCGCGMYFITPPAARAVLNSSKEKESFPSKIEFQFWGSQNENALTSLLKLFCFASENININSLKPSFIKKKKLNCL